MHRDIKPDNILIERGSGRAMVTDFGIARARSVPGVTDRLTLEGQLLGTAAFMSPEQGAGEHVDGRSDLYSLGGVGFYALTGRAPFEATTLEAVLVARFTRAAPAVASIRPDVPTALAATIDRCLAREPHDRFASGEAVAEALSEGTGIAGTQEVAPPVRSFLRAAEQTLWLASLIIVFTIIYGLPTGRSIAPILFGIAAGIVIVSIDLFRRARELLGEGFDASDVRRGFRTEKQAHAEEMRRLFDARRTAARRRLGRRAWTVLAVGIVARVGLQIAMSHMPRADWRRLIPLMVVVDITNTVSLVIGLNASPLAERRMFRLAAWMWQSRFARGFFWLAGIGRARPEKRGHTLNADTPSYRLIDLAPATVKAAYPDLPDLLRRLDTTQAGLRMREAEVARALTESGGGRLSAHRLDEQASVTTSGGFTTPSEHALEDRRVALLDEMRDALQSTRARRTTIAAALENARIQLLRVGAGVGSADDMRQEVAALRALADDHGAAVGACSATGARSGGMTTDRTLAEGGVLRPLLLALIAIGAAGLEVELILLEHYESAWQFTPLVLLGVVLVGAGVVWRRPSPSTVRFFQAVMLLCVAAGVVGVFLHYRGNVEFELEREPLHGLRLFWEAIRGATPALAPGAMAQLGLLGLVYSYRHPALRRDVPEQTPGTINDSSERP